MLRRVTRISPWQAAKFCAVLYFIMGLIFAIPFALIMSATGQGGAGIGIGMAIAIPFGYAIGALIVVPIGCWVFNFVAGLVGGLEFTVSEPEGA